MFWRRRPAPLPTTHPDVHHFRRQLRNIEWALGPLSTRNPDDITEIRKLTYDHSRYREALLTHGVDHPIPVIHW